MKQKLLFRHRNVLKSMKKVEALSRLAGGNPRGCNVGFYRDEAVAKAAALVMGKGRRKIKSFYVKEM